MTFFALIREMLEGEEVLFVKKRCPRHPIKKIETIEINPQLEYSAYVGGILTAGKIEDNINDEKGAKRSIASFLRLFFSKMEREADKNLPELACLVSDKLAELHDIEEGEVASIDIPADVFGDMMASLLSYGLDGDKKLVASNIGKRIGRWIYIVDAFDDYDKDRKSGSYNPFVLLYDAENFSEDNLISISKMLEAELALALSAIDLLDEDSDKTRSEIIKNILCLGMPQSVKKVCDKHRKAENK